MQEPDGFSKECTCLSVMCLPHSVSNRLPCCVCVYVYACICTYMHMHICVYVYVCVCMYMHVCICACVYACECVCTYVLCVCMYMHGYTCVSTCVYACICSMCGLFSACHLHIAFLHDIFICPFSGPHTPPALGTSSDGTNILSDAQAPKFCPSMNVLYAHSILQGSPVVFSL